MIYSIITIICLALLSLWLFYILYNIVGRRREKRTVFMRDTSKAKYALIYIISYLIYFTGRIYAKESILDAVYFSFENTVNTILLTFRITPIEKLMNDSVLFSVTVYICFTFIVINVLLFAFSLIGQYVWLSWKGLAFHSLSKKPCVIIFGNNENSRCIYNSAKTGGKKYKPLLIDEMDRKTAESLFMSKIFYSASNKLVKAQRIADLLKRSKTKKNYIIVINTDDDESNLKICSVFSDLIKKMSNDEFDALKTRLLIFVFGKTEHESVFLQQEFSGRSIIRFVNRYIAVSHNFAVDFPLTRYMSENQIDHETALIRNDAVINVILIGFGRNNQQNFMTLAVNNQFLTKEGGKTVQKKVNYYIFDKIDSHRSRRINHTYHRLDREFGKETDQNKYLPLPDAPANETYYKISTDSPNFNSTLKQILTKNPKGCNFMIISVGSDIMNIEIAEKVYERQRDWGVGFFKLFVKVSDINASYLHLHDGAYTLVGDEKNTVYNIDRLLESDLINIAKEIDRSYAEMSKKVKDDPADEKEDKKSEDWYSPQYLLKRFSNISCAMNLRTKLNLIGLDYEKADTAGDGALSKEQYLSYYAKTECSNKDYYIKGQKPFDFKYSPEYPDTKRTNLAMQEHLRWNAFMIRLGFVPAAIDQIRADGKNHGKNYEKHIHFKLTTHEGLLQYRKMLVEEGFKEEDVDVLQKDFVVMDNLYDILESCGYAIVKKR